MTINVLNEFLPPAEDIRKGAIKVGNTLGIDSNDILNVDSSAVLGTYYSNCITEIPQDITLELTDGTLTLKAGSKVYVPNGSSVFDNITIASDKTSGTISGLNGSFFVLYYSNQLVVVGVISSSSGTTPPTDGLFYNTSTNKICLYSGGSIAWDTVSFPFATVTYTNGIPTSIDQVFNGAGYIGHHAFILPGVKGLIADGKTDKGTVKSILTTVSNVIVRDLTTISNTPVPTYDNQYAYLTADGAGLQISHYYSYDSLSELFPKSGFQYIYETNYLYFKSNDTQTTISEVPFIEISVKDNVVTQFDILQPIRMASKNDKVNTTGTFLFDYRWSDHNPNKISWVDATAFSWLDGNVYKGAYEELLAAWNGQYTSKTDNNVTYRDTAKGYQIAGPDQEEAIVNAWSTLHAAWFYILDIENKRFKLPRLASTQILEARQNGNSWYRIYADDWCEQGGYSSNSGHTSAYTATVNLWLAMRDTSYQILRTVNKGGIDNAPGTKWISGVNANTKTTTSFQMFTDQQGYVPGDFWEVKGFGAPNMQSTSSYGPIKHLYFYLGYSDAQDVNKKEIDLDVKTEQCKAAINTKTEEGITKLNTDSNALHYTQVTNCVIQTTQHARLELNAGILTLKAGSKTFIPNGFEEDSTTPKFDEVIVENDIIFNEPWTTSVPCFLQFSPPNLLIFPDINDTKLIYDITTNKISYDNTEQYWSLPIAIVTRDATGISCINQVFNDMGYIDRSTFTLPGIKALIPNGRNSDGTLNNIEVITQKVYTNTNSGAGMHKHFFLHEGTESYTGINYRVGTTTPTDTAYVRWYNPQTNIMLVHGDNETVWHQVNEVYLGEVFYGYNAAGNRIQQFIARTPYAIMERNDSEDYVVEWQLPTETNPNWYRKYKSGWMEQGGRTTSVAEKNHIFTFPFPFKSIQYWVHATNDQVEDAGINVYAFRPIDNTKCYLVSGYNGTFYAEKMHWTAKGY